MQSSNLAWGIRIPWPSFRLQAWLPRHPQCFSSAHATRSTPSFLLAVTLWWAGCWKWVQLRPLFQTNFLIASSIVTHLFRHSLDIPYIYRNWIQWLPVLTMSSMRGATLSGGCTSWSLQIPFTGCSGHMRTDSKPTKCRQVPLLM